MLKKYKQYILENSDQVTQSNEIVKQIENEINQLINNWVSELKKSLVDPQSSVKRGVWDRFKNTFSNLWHGRYNQSNPYFWKNKLGDDLGATESARIFSLSDYKYLKESCDDIENIMLEDNSNLRIFKLIDLKANELKNKLNQIFTRPEVLNVMPHKNGGGDDYNSNVTPVNNNSTTTTAPAATATAAPANPSNNQTNNQNNSNQNNSNHQLLPNVEPTTGKDWANLSDHEKDAWNIYGGGVEVFPTKIDTCVNKLGIIKFPWILRIGDPRRKVLNAQEEGRLEGCLNRKNSPIKNTLQSQGRLETPDNRISTWEELEERVKKAKQIVDNVRLSRKRKPQPNSISNTVEPISKSIDQPNNTVEPISKSIDQTDTSSNNTKNKKEKLKRRAATVDMPGAKPPVNNEYQETKQRIIQKLNNVKGDVVSDGDKQKFIDKILSSSDEDELRRYEDSIDLLNQELTFDWTIRDSLNYYKNKLIFS